MDKDIKVQDLHSYCRTCLAENDGCKYEVEQLPRAILTLFKQVTGFPKTQNDSFPKWICNSCFYKIKSFSEFRVMSKKSTKFLQELVIGCHKKDFLVQEEKIVEETTTQKSEILNDVSRKNCKENDAQNIGTTQQKSRFEHIFLETNIKENQFEVSKQFSSPTDALSTTNATDCSANVMQAFECNIKIEEKDDKEESTENTTCKVCSLTCSTIDVFEAHKHTHLEHEQPEFRCEKCNTGFNAKRQLKTHIKNCYLETKKRQKYAENLKEISCKFGCGKVFRHQKNAINHYSKMHKLQETQEIKSIENTYVCEGCGRIFKSMSRLREHSFAHRPIEDRPFKCEQCSKGFTKKRVYEDHLLRHAGIKNFECPHCGGKKTTLKELKQHVKLHTSKKTYSCGICSKIFKRPQKLKLHDRVVHQGERRYKCSYCDQAFGKPDNLKHHLMRHTGERPHKCQICDRGFIQAVALRSHMKTHAKQ